MATLTARDASGPTTKFVPIRPAFRPLLPKPSHSETQLHEPTVVLKSQQQRRITKKRKEPHVALSAAAVASLPATISPAKLMQKPEELKVAPVAATPVAQVATPVAPAAVATPVVSATSYSPSDTTPGTPFSLFSHMDDPALSEEFADAGFDGVAGLSLEFDSPYISSSALPEMDFFTSNMDMFS